MDVLHGSWVPATAPWGARFAVWGESITARGGTGGRRSAAVGEQGRYPRHPFACGRQGLLEALGALSTAVSPADAIEGRTAGRQGGGVLVRLPAAGGRPLPSPEAAGEARPSVEQGYELSWWRVPALQLEAVPAARLLLTLGAVPAPGLTIGDDLRCWIAVSRFALELIHRQRLLPHLEQAGTDYLVRWRPLLNEERDGLRLGQLAAAMPPAGRALAWQPPAAGAAPPAPAPARDLLLAYLAAVADGVARQAGGEILAPDGRRRSAPARAPSEAWWQALFGDPRLRDGPPEAMRAFADQYRTWTARDPAGQASDTFRVCFRLDPPATEPGAPQATASMDGQAGGAAGAGAPRWTLHYLLQATDDPSLLVPAAEVWRQRGETARFLKRRLERPQERLLAGLGKAARLFPPLEPSLRVARPEASTLSTPEAYRFLREAALLLKSSGFGVLVPGLETKLRLRVRLGRHERGEGQGAGQASFGWDSLVAYDWQVALGDETLSKEEFEQLARLKEPLVRVRGRWVELDPEQVEQALAFLERRRDDEQLPLPEALQLALAGEGPAGLPVAGVETAGWIDDLVAHLRHGGRPEPVPEPPGFNGRLRPYQKVGVAWMQALHHFGIGACLADDMGLGKTIQLIALLLHTRGRRGLQAATRPALLICPTSVVGNWRHELARFAPSLRVLVHHGAARARERLAEEAPHHDVVLSTYALLHRDEAALLAVEWEEVVLDEAQNIKNASTKAAQAARRLRCRWRAALTGTPVENRLSELWSIFHFLNPGYLGSAEAFRRRYARPIERAGDAGATQRLKALVAPFILRRLKTDRSIIRDLPEKQEMKVFCTLTAEQATLYEAVVRDAMAQIEAAEGVQRRGLILATLTRLKQVCNHPALFLHDGSELRGRSGKLARLTEMLEEALAVEDRALIFTQYAEMGRMLKTHLEARLGGPVLFLHGGTPAAERDRMVARFQGDRHAPRLFVLSLKAGGTGLNLTGANHVFHFDRWWNPAVENQATDRAFRIGQRRRVQVHKLLCAGTFEETIDELIERKEALSQAITGTSEAWITEMSTSELRDLLTLRGEATGDTGQPEPAREAAGAAEVTTGVTATARRQRT